MVILIKLGGSLITDKRQHASYRAHVVERLAAEIQILYDAHMPIILGHGAGSFGHIPAQYHDTIHGVDQPHQWLGFAEVAAAATDLNYRLGMTLRQANLPIWRLSPSASTICERGRIVRLETYPIQVALEHRLIPLVHGDVAVDTHIGGTIVSTESVFFYLTQHLPVQRIILMGEVDGVYDQDGNVIPVITTDNFAQIASALGGSEGTDVTGGMASKVQSMLNLIQIHPQLSIEIVNGLTSKILVRLLLENEKIGTRILDRLMLS